MEKTVIKHCTIMADLMLIDYKSKKIIVADLDGTLAESKHDIDSEMAGLICSLLSSKHFAIAGGGSYDQFSKQVVSKLECSSEKLQKLLLFPVNGSMLYVYDNGWKNEYYEGLSEVDKAKIFKEFEKALADCNYEKPERIWGDAIEDRGTQITFSALGQKAPLEFKLKWDPDQKKRLAIKEKLDKSLPEFDIRLGGTTSIDITKKGINKAYAIKKIEEKGFKREEICYIGDALYEGGNDSIVCGLVDTLQVSGPQQTKEIFRSIIKGGE